MSVVHFGGVEDRDEDGGVVGCLGGGDGVGGALGVGRL